MRMGDSDSAGSSSGCDPAVKPTSKRPNESGLGMMLSLLEDLSVLSVAGPVGLRKNPICGTAGFFHAFNLKNFSFFCPKIAANFD
jgi:hypothetical protein